MIVVRIADITNQFHRPYISSCGLIFILPDFLAVLNVTLVAGTDHSTSSSRQLYLSCVCSSVFGP